MTNYECNGLNYKTNSTKRKGTAQIEDQLIL